MRIIKNKQLKAIFTAGLLSLAFSLVISISAPQSVGAQQSVLNDILAHCKKTAKKAVGSCKVASEQAANKATYNCKKTNNRDNCIKRKAKSYITKAAKGNPSDSKFKSQLRSTLDKVKGDANTPYTFPATIASDSFYGGSKGKYQCGGDDTEIVTTKIDFGCMGPDQAPEDMNAIVDLALAIIRFLSTGVGLIVVASIIWAGIQYSTSEGNPEATQAAKSRVRNSLIGLIVYILGFSIIQFLVPGGLFAS